MKISFIAFACKLKEIVLFPFTENFAINHCFGDPRYAITSEEAERLKKLFRSEDK